MRGIRLPIKLTMIVILAVSLTAMASAVLVILIGKTNLETRESSHNVESAQSYATAISFYLENARSVLETSSHMPEIIDFTSARFIDPKLHGLPTHVDKGKRNVAKDIMEHSKIFEYIMLLRADGLVYFLEPYDLQLKISRHDLSFFRWYKDLMNSGKTVVSDLHISPATQKPTVMIATPVYNSIGHMIGIWAGALKLEEISKFGGGGIERGTLTHYGYVTDSRGLIIVHQANSQYVKEQTDFSSVEPVRAALAGQRGTTQFFNSIEGQDNLGAYLPLPGTGWAVVYVVPTGIAFAPMYELSRNILLVAVGLAIILGLASGLLVRKFTKPIEWLTVGVEKIGAGDFTQRINIKTGDEIGRLANEFNKMATALSEKDVKLQEYAGELERKVRERTSSLRESEERFRLVAESSTDLIYEWDIKERIDWFGKIDQLLGYAQGEFPRMLKGWADSVHPDDIDRVMVAVKNHLDKNEPYESEYRIRKKDGTYNYWWARGTAVRDEQGNPYRWVGAVSDITERKRAEEEIHQLNAGLEQRIIERTAELEAANKELEAFSYSVSHDLRAPLRAIDGFSQVIIEDYSDKLDNEGKRILSVIRSNTKKMGQLIDDLLAFARLGRKEIDLSEVNMDRVAKVVFDELKATVLEQAIQWNIKTLPPAHGDRSMIQQVFVNLLSNAIKFTRPKEIALIEMEGRSDGNENVYCIRDNGVGFDMRYVRKLFGVFQRLHSSAEFEGTGVGLAIVQRIIHRHGGRVWAEGKVNEGATFYFSLPRK